MDSSAFFCHLFGPRSVRLTGSNLSDTIIDAAWDAGLGVQAMVWVSCFFIHQFCFISDARFTDILLTRQFGQYNEDFLANKWQGRRDKLLGTLHTNPKAKFVTRALQFGSGALTVSHFATPDLLADQINAAKKNLTSLGIPVTISIEVLYYTANAGSQSVLDAIDFVDLVQLPYYSDDASIAFKSWPDITSDLEWVTSRVNGKKIMLSMNGWPQVTPPGTSDGHAVASLEQMVDYFVLFELLCSVLARNAGGGVAWFAGVYSVEQDPYLGILKNGQPQFSFSPPTSC